LDRFLQQRFFLELAENLPFFILAIYLERFKLQC